MGSAVGSFLENSAANRIGLRRFRFLICVSAIQSQYKSVVCIQIFLIRIFTSLARFTVALRPTRIKSLDTELRQVLN
jgi:hypothetical protein